MISSFRTWMWRCAPWGIIVFLDVYYTSKFVYLCTLRNFFELNYLLWESSFSWMFIIRRSLFTYVLLEDCFKTNYLLFSKVWAPSHPELGEERPKATPVTRTCTEGVKPLQDLVLDLVAFSAISLDRFFKGWQNQNIFTHNYKIIFTFGSQIYSIKSFSWLLPTIGH